MGNRSGIVLGRVLVPSSRVDSISGTTNAFLVMVQIRQPIAQLLDCLLVEEQLQRRFIVFPACVAAGAPPLSNDACAVFG